MKNALSSFSADIPHVISVVNSGAVGVANSQAVQGVIRIGRFLRSCIQLRSISLALWVRAYDNFTPTHGQQ